MNDDSMQRPRSLDDQHAASGRTDERDPGARTLPWLDDAVEELFGAAPARGWSGPAKWPL